MNAFIKSLMDESGINQKELAGILGISASAVSQWKECSLMSVETLVALSKLFQITVGELVAEKYEDETIEQKWDRLYNLDEHEWEEIVEDYDVDVMIQYLEKICAINDNFYKLLYKKMIGRASDIELQELSIIERYFQPDPWQSFYFYDKRFDCPTKEMEKWIGDILNETIGYNNESAMVWELQRIYRNTKTPTSEQIKTVDNDDVFYAWFSALNQEQKDSILTNVYRQNADNVVLYELIRRGGRILYSDSDLPQLNYEKVELDQYEGEKKPLKELNKIKEIFCNRNVYWRRIPYEQHQIIINGAVMKQVEMEYKFKKKNPIKYWEFIKQGGGYKKTSKGNKVSGNTHTQKQLNHHSNQCNPNNAANKAARDNRANQLNPNNSAWRSREGREKK